MTKVRGDGNPGRTSEIGKVVRYDDDGQPVTVAQAIVEAVQVGFYMEPAIAATGVAKPTVYLWMKTAGLARLRAKGDTATAELTEHERACCDFLDALEAAKGMWEYGANCDLDRLGRGGIPTEVVTIKVDAEGKTETTTRTTATLPDAKVLMWRLERAVPSRYGQRIQIDETSPAEPSLDERVSALLESAREWQEREHPKKVRAHRPKAPAEKPL